METFYKLEFKGLVRHVLKCSGSTDVDEARDAVQTAFAEAFVMWEEIEYPKAWLRKVALREYYRRPAPQPIAEVPDTTLLDDVATRTEAAREEMLVCATLQSLPFKQRQALAWTFDGFSPKEIAKELGVDPAAVRQNIAKGRRKLRTLLAEQSEGE
ncbi:RNA polymerase sigma factor [Actinomadura rayongensis]|uniref:Sigma-70 family RNA polymerase sigma factor n=1 Tax=Actinomadura rayongensis TaxID=1429076 RepID=A0A6I4WBI2_9ACTN|nr:sigma-70 family RNA polymerase sigma factor [Actinomadura rayongensis]MXQ67038.1 sigma-70 family RNA polymerase sigma factor [Actinomadura rayongensis]